MHTKSLITKIIFVAWACSFTTITLAQLPIEERIRNFKIPAKEESVISRLRDQIATMLMNNDKVGAIRLTDSLKQNFENQSKRAFLLYENFALEMALGRPDSAVMGFTNQRISPPGLKPFYPFSTQDFFAKSLFAIYSISITDSSYQNSTTLGDDGKELIRLFRAAYRIFYNYPRDESIVEDSDAWLNVNARLYLKSFPAGRFSKYAEEFTRSQTFVSNHGIPYIIGGEIIIPLGKISNVLKTGGGFFLTSGWDTEKIRYRIGLQINQMNLRHQVIIRTDTLAKDKGFQHILFTISPQYQFHQTDKFRHWLSPQLGIGSSKIIKNAENGDKKAEFTQLGASFNYSIGYDLNYTFPQKQKMVQTWGGRYTRNTTRFFFSFCVRVGYQDVPYGFSGAYLSTGLSVGILLGRLTNQPSSSEMKRMRW